VQLYDFGVTDDGTLYYVMELAPEVEPRPLRVIREARG
jgi:hypothetical protein